MAPPPNMKKDLLPLKETSAKTEIKESFFEEESSSFDLLRGGLDDEALLSLESGGIQGVGNTPEVE